MLSAWNFVKNYKKPILVTASVISGFIGLRSYISTFEQQWQNSASRTFVSEVHKKGSYFDNAVEIGNDMANAQYVQVIKTIQELFHIDDLLTALKEAKQNGLTSKERLMHFENIKLEIFSYAVSEVYAITFFVTYMRVQLSITSGKMYFDNQQGNSTKLESNDSSLLADSNSSYSMFLQLLENYHQFGVEHIVTHVRKVVRECFENMSVTEKVTIRNVLDVLEKVKTTMAASYSSLIEENAAIVFSSNKEHLTSEELNSQSKVFNEMKRCSKMIDEMLDIVKIADFAKVIDHCTSIGFSNLYDFISECFMKFGNETINGGHPNEQSFLQERQFINPNQIVIPLVKLLPEIWRQLNQSAQGSCVNGYTVSFEFNDAKKNRNSLLVQFLLRSDSLTCFSANIYEAFCNENDVAKIL